MVTVDETPPKVSITAPADGSTVTGTVTISANATDNNSVAGVQFLVDGAALGSEVTTQPYQISWNTAGLANGAHSVSAKARDAAGLTTTSIAINVITSNVASSFPGYRQSDFGRQRLGGNIGQYGSLLDKCAE